MAQILIPTDSLGATIDIPTGSRFIEAPVAMALDTFTLTDPNSQLVSASDDGGVWTVTINDSHASTGPDDAPVWIRPARTAQGQLFNHPIPPGFWRIAVTSGPGNGTGMLIVSGLVNGSTMASAFLGVGIDYSQPSPRVNAFSGGIQSNSATNANVVQAWGEICGRPSTVTDPTTQTVPRYLTSAGANSAGNSAPVQVERVPAIFSAATVFQFVAVMGVSGGGNLTASFKPEQLWGFYRTDLSV